MLHAILSKIRQKNKTLHLARTKKPISVGYEHAVRGHALNGDLEILADGVVEETHLGLSFIISNNIGIPVEGLAVVGSLGLLLGIIRTLVFNRSVETTKLYFATDYNMALLALRETNDIHKSSYIISICKRHHIALNRST